MIIFKEIEIIGLFGETNVKISILENRLILVGYNGIGKSTILNIFYYFISQQWSKLREQDFESVSLRLKNKNRKLTIHSSEIPDYLEFQKRSRIRLKYGNRYKSGLMAEAFEILIRLTKQTDNEPSHRMTQSKFRNYIEILSDELSIPNRIADDLVREFRHSRRQHSEFTSKGFQNIASVSDFLNENLHGRILYLPTYRRIEKDIKTVFPEIEEELQRKLTRRGRDGFRDNNYIELVQFGMEDVKEKIARHLENVRAYAFSQINSLTAKYLRDVIRGEVSKLDDIQTSQISEKALQSVFSKVDRTILSDTDKFKLTEVVEKMGRGSDLLENEKYVAHYVLFLAEVGDNIAKLENPILQFVKVCNSYLYGKSFNFDNVSYLVEITHDSGRPVEMEELSSGEKQIVSLFSHLILDQDVSNYIIIDEPELSLSVDWQQRFLEDISGLKTCAFIGAVTHSPFIFENSLERHTVDLLEHMRPT